jgi:hypothetical protein
MKLNIIDLLKIITYYHSEILESSIMFLYEKHEYLLNYVIEIYILCAIYRYIYNQSSF